MNRIREARRMQDIKQIDLCARLGISQAALSGWETGKYNPDTAGWIALSEELGVSVDYLMGLTVSEKIENGNFSTDEISLIDSYRCLTAQGKQYIRQQMDFAKINYTKNSFFAEIG